jgi:hypothetical protein
VTYMLQLIALIHDACTRTCYYELYAVHSAMSITYSDALCCAAQSVHSCCRLCSGRLRKNRCARVHSKDVLHFAVHTIAVGLQHTAVGVISWEGLSDAPYCVTLRTSNLMALVQAVQKVTTYVHTSKCITYASV